MICPRMARMNADKSKLIGSESATISEIRGKFRVQTISASDLTGGSGGRPGTKINHQSTLIDADERNGLLATNGNAPGGFDTY